MNKFEQLIEYVINDEQAKARELFHEIVVEKSRQIYEEIMDEEDKQENEDEDQDIEESMDEQMGGDAADDLIDDVEADETGVSMEDEEEEFAADEEMVDSDTDDHHGDVGGDEELEDRVIDLEDKLDELMSEFEALMNDDADSANMDADMDAGMDAGMDADMSMVDDELETEGMMPMEESVDLKAAPKPVTSEEGNVNKKSTVAANSGARGAMAKPVSTGTDGGGHHDSAAYKNTVKELGVPSTQEAGKKAFKSAAPKATNTQASGVNTKSLFK